MKYTFCCKFTKVSDCVLLSSNKGLFTGDSIFFYFTIFTWIRSFEVWPLQCRLMSSNKRKRSSSMCCKENWLFTFPSWWLSDFFLILNWTSAFSDRVQSSLAWKNCRITTDPATGIRSARNVKSMGSTPVTDPRGGGANPPGGRQHTILPNFPKNCMQLKEFEHGGGGAHVQNFTT